MNKTSQAAAGADSLNEAIRHEYCAKVSQAHQEDPIGTAPAQKRYLLVEVPLPWEYRIEDSKHFPKGLSDVLNEAARKGCAFRFLGFASDTNPSPAGFRRVMHYRRPAPPFALFEKQEYVVPEDQLNALAEAVLAQDGAPLRFADYEVAQESRDFFVCTHGNRDVCCGKFGYPIYKEIEDRYAAGAAGKVRVWRTSHIGGHRHAPTLIDFPEGRYWAQLSSERLDALVLRKGSVAELARHYRGWGGIGPFEQVAEREMFVREGWHWIRYEKQAALRKQDDDIEAWVRIEYSLPDGSVAGAYEARVQVVGTVPTGGCGSGPGEARQYKVTGLTKSGKA